MNVYQFVAKVKQKYTKTNTHLNCDSLYGHMSKVDNIHDTDKFPDLLKAHPVKFTLNAGEALIIPRGWWHYVESFENMYGCNFWTEAVLSEEPKKINHNVVINFDTLKDYDIYILSSDETLVTEDSIKFSEYITKKTDNTYFWTLLNYNQLKRNKHISKEVLSKIHIPSIIKNTNKNFEFNVMASSSYQATPLHYDDEDGLLCVTAGKKEVVLYPPEDTKYLYPVVFEKYPWMNAPAIECCYNLHRIGQPIEGKSSANLLFETCKDNVGVLSTISQTLKFFKNKTNETVWGFKKQNDRYGWELYNYKAEENTNCIITSYDIFPTRNSDGNYRSASCDKYYLLEHTNDYFYGTITRKANTNTPSQGYWILNRQNIFLQNFDNYLSKIRLWQNVFDKTIVEQYKADLICVHQKFNDEFYIQYIGISKDDFIKFLVNQEYEQKLIDSIKNNEYNISNEIAIVYDLKTGTIKRSGFYGIV